MVGNKNSLPTLQEINELQTINQPQYKGMVGNKNSLPTLQEINELQTINQPQ